MGGGVAKIEDVIWYAEDSVSPLTVAKPAAFASGEILVAVIMQHTGTSNLADLTTPDRLGTAGHRQRHDHRR